MKTATAKELRIRASALLEDVRKGNEVIITRRGKSVAVLKPIEKTSRQFKAVGFGMWKSEEKMKDAAAWVDERRKERYQR